MQKKSINPPLCPSEDEAVVVLALLVAPIEDGDLLTDRVAVCLREYVDLLAAGRTGKEAIESVVCADGTIILVMAVSGAAAGICLEDLRG